MPILLKMSKSLIKLLVAMQYQRVLTQNANNLRIICSYYYFARNLELVKSIKFTKNSHFYSV